MAAAPINIDDYKTKLQGLKARAETLATKKTALERDITIQEEAQKRAIQELKDLGYAEVEGMTPQELEKFGTTLAHELVSALEELEKTVVAAEGLLGISTSSSELD